LGYQLLASKAMRKKWLKVLKAQAILAL